MTGYFLRIKQNKFKTARTSAARFERRICPASPIDITRSAMLIPAPATFDLSLTSVVPLTGPVLIPHAQF